MQAEEASQGFDISRYLTGIEYYGTNGNHDVNGNYFLMDINSYV